VGEDNDPDGHHEQRRCLARDRRWAAGEFLVQEEPGQPDVADRVGDGDDGQDRREQRARLEGVLVEHEADRADDGDGVDRPVGEQIRQSAAEFGGRELDREVRDCEGGAAGQCERERPRRPVPPGHGQAAGQHRGEPGQQRYRLDEADSLPPCRRPGDDEEPDDPGRAGENSRARDQVHAFSQGRGDQAGEYQVAHQDRLDQREGPESQRHDLQDKAGHIRADSRQPQRLLDQVQQQFRRQRPPGLDALGGELLGDGRYRVRQRGAKGCHHGDQREQRPVRRFGPAGLTAALRWEPWRTVSVSRTLASLAFASTSSGTVMFSASALSAASRHCG
jgi:hypothetical protein